MSIMRKSFDNVNHKASVADASSADGVMELVHAVMHLMRSRQFQTLRDGPHGVTQMESKVLGFFGRHAGATLSDLAQHSGRDKAQLARLIKGLRERGLLHGEADVADKRNLRLSLSPEALAVQRALALQARQLGAKAVSGFSAVEREQLQALLQRVRVNLLDGAGPQA